MNATDSSNAWGGPGGLGLSRRIGREIPSQEPPLLSFAEMDMWLLRAGLLAAPWWIVTIAIFGALEPGHSHLYNAASELGAFGAANPLAMNIVCFLITGLLVVLAGLGFRSKLRSFGVSTAAARWVIVLGLMLAGAAVPADMELYFRSPWTIVHAFFVFLGVIPFLVAAWLTHSVFKRLGCGSRMLSHLPWIIVPVFLLHGILEQGGLVQRLTILIVLFWIGYLSRHLMSSVDMRAVAVGKPQLGSS